MADTELIDHTGRTVFRGTQKPPGGLQPVASLYSGNGVSIADGSGFPLSWDSLDSGPELFDRTTPTAPTFLAAGCYVITALVSCSTPLTAGGFAAVTLSGISGQIAIDSDHPDFTFGLTLAVVTGAGDALIVQVFNADGAAPRTYQLTAPTSIVRLA